MATSPSQPTMNLPTSRTLRPLDPTTGMPMSQLSFGGRRRSSLTAGTSNAEGYTPDRGLSVTEIMRQRQNRPGAYNSNTGQAVPQGTILQVPGWDTSGVGPGTRGYRGSYTDGGYNGGWGTGRPSARTSGDYYANQGSSLDQFNNNATFLPPNPWGTSPRRMRSLSGSNSLGGGMIDGARQYGGPVRRGGRYLVGEDGPEVVVMPQEGYVMPNPRSRRAPSFRTADEYYAYRDQTMGNPLDRGARRYGSPTIRDVGPMTMGGGAADWASPPGPDAWSGDNLFQTSPLDEIEGRAAPFNGEVREGRDGRMWRYDANLGRGVPVNVYDEPGTLHAPSPPVELMDPQERFNDLRMRLSALQSEASRNFQDRRQFEEAKFVQPPVQGLTSGPTSTGRAISGRYGRGSVSTAPVEKSFMVDRTDGTRGSYNNLADATTESRAEAATRRMRSRRY